MCVVSSLSLVQLFETPWTMACQAPLSTGILQARRLEWVAMPSSRGSSQPRSPELQADSVLSKPPGKPKNTRVGGLSLLQGNFPTRELNRGLLHCTWILYQLSYPGSPIKMLGTLKNLNSYVEGSYDLLWKTQHLLS